MPPLCGKRRCKSWVFCCLLNDRRGLSCLDMFRSTIPVEGMADRSSTMIVSSFFFGDLLVVFIFPSKIG